MKLKRGNLLLLLAGGLVAVALAMSTRDKKSPMSFINPTAQTPAKAEPSFTFKLIKGSLSLETSAIAPEQQVEQYNELLPEGFFLRTDSSLG